MSYIGLQHIVAAPIEKENENAMPTYGAGVLVGRGINADVTFNRADVTLEADDATVESDNSIIGGSIRLGVDDLSDAARVALLGDMAVSAENSDEEYDEVGKAAPYVGVAYVRTRMYNGKLSYRAMWVPKAQFGTTDESAQTRGRQTQFQTPTINGNIMGVEVEGVMRFRRRSKFFDTAAAAIAWANAKVNYTDTTAAAAQA